MSNYKLKDLIGKPVTIFTENIGRNFNDSQYNDYFTGILTSCDSDILETVHPITKCKNLFFIKKIIGICEEQSLDPNNPEHQKIINQMNGSNETIEEKNQDLPLSDSINIDVDMLNKLIDKN
jgi:hypothetical protein